MARIRYIAPSPKAGTTEHVQPHIAAVLVAAGFAEHVPYANFVEFMTAEHAQASGFGNVSGPPVVAGVEWALVHHLPVSGRPCIVRKSGTEVQHFESLTFWHPYGDPSGKEYPIAGLKECPASIKQQFAQLLCPGGGRDQDRIEREQSENDRATKTLTDRFFRALGVQPDEEAQ